MKTLFHKAIVIFMLLVMMFNQVQPVAALQNTAPTAATDKTETAIDPSAQRGMGKKAAKPVLYNQPAAPQPEKLKIKLSADPKFITTSPAQVVKINWELKGDLPDPSTSAGTILKISFPAGYTPLRRSQSNPEHIVDKEI